MIFFFNLLLALLATSQKLSVLEDGGAGDDAEGGEGLGLLEALTGEDEAGLALGGDLEVGDGGVEVEGDLLIGTKIEKDKIR